jgi:hypothetical protein
MKSGESFKKLPRITWASDVMLNSIMEKGNRWRTIVKKREIQRRCIWRIPAFRIKTTKSLKIFR